METYSKGCAILIYIVETRELIKTCLFEHQRYLRPALLKNQQCPAVVSEIIKYLQDWVIVTCFYFSVLIWESFVPRFVNNLSNHALPLDSWCYFFREFCLRIGSQLEFRCFFLRNRLIIIDKSFPFIYHYNSIRNRTKYFVFQPIKMKYNAIHTTDNRRNRTCAKIWSIKQSLSKCFIG